MKKLILISLFFVISGLFSETMEDSIVLHPRLSYRVETEDELKIEDYHLFGDKVQSNGEIKEHKDSKYVYLEKEGKPYYTYFYFVIQNSTQGVILEDSFIYSTDDLSTITEDRVDKLTFVAIDKSSLNKDLLKVSYLNKNDKGWFISKGWIKKTAISTKKDDWGTAIKFFNATQAETKEDKESILGTVFMFNSKTVFSSIIQKMLDEDHLKVNDQEYRYDELFAGTNEALFTKYNGAVYAQADTESEVLSEGGVEITLNKRLSASVIENGSIKYWYYVNTGEVEGWILK